MRAGSQGKSEDRGDPRAAVPPPLGHSSTGSEPGRQSWVPETGFGHTPRQDGAMFEDWVVYKLRLLI